MASPGTDHCPGVTVLPVALPSGPVLGLIASYRPPDSRVRAELVLRTPPSGSRLLPGVWRSHRGKEPAWVGLASRFGERQCHSQVASVPGLVKLAHPPELITSFFHLNKSLSYNLHRHLLPLLKAVEKMAVLAVWPPAE